MNKDERRSRELRGDIVSGGICSDVEVDLSDIDLSLVSCSECAKMFNCVECIGGIK